MSGRGDWGAKCNTAGNITVVCQGRIHAVMRVWVSTLQNGNGIGNGKGWIMIDRDMRFTVWTFRTSKNFRWGQLRRNWIYWGLRTEVSSWQEVTWHRSGLSGYLSSTNFSVHWFCRNFGHTHYRSSLSPVGSTSSSVSDAGMFDSSWTVSSLADIIQT
jgi:hypothetical protein